MAWLYLPESVDWNWDLISSSPTSKPFVMSKGKYITLNSLKGKLKRENLSLDLSLVTLNPLEKSLICSLEKWVGCLEVSPVNPSLMPEIEKEQMMKGGFGNQSLKLLAHVDLTSYSLRTFQTSLMTLGHTTKYALPYPKSGSIWNGRLYERQMLAQTIKETGFLSSDIEKKPLNSLIQNFPTPTASDGIRSSKTYGAGNLTLLGAVMMPTPTANDATNWTMPPSQLKRKDNLTKAITKLENMERFPTPIATDQEKMSTGSLHRKLCLTPKEGMLRPIGGKMNPEFVEWLMGWPLGHTELEPVEMA